MPDHGHDLQPRMLRLVGRLADGWLPCAAYCPPDQLPAMNRAIDEAAAAAGRDPAAIRRLYNIDASFDADQIAALALEEGLSGFVLAVDDPDAVRRFAEVAEEVRETVAAARGMAATSTS